MIERQTKENLAKVIVEELGTFGVDTDQIFAIAHDNGANMCASVKLLKSLSKPVSDEEAPLSNMLVNEFKLLDEYGSDEYDCACSEEVTEETVQATVDENEEVDDFENGEDGSPDILVNDDDIEEPEIMNSIRCGAHTAQLVAYDVIKLYKTRLAKINKICLAMHHKVNRELFLLHRIPLPPKVNETRWGVWFILQRYLQILRTKPFLSTLQAHDPTLGMYFIL